MNLFLFFSFRSASLFFSLVLLLFLLWLTVVNGCMISLQHADSPPAKSLLGRAVIHSACLLDHQIRIMDALDPCAQVPVWRIEESV